MQSINMTNPQKNEIKQFKKDINLLQDKFKQLKKWGKTNHKNER